MAAAERTQRCRYCGKEEGTEHSEACPERISLVDCWDVEKAQKQRQELIDEWFLGWTHGFNDDTETRNVKHRSRTYRLGYWIGNCEIDRLVDEAAQSRYFDDREYD